MHQEELSVDSETDDTETDYTSTDDSEELIKSHFNHSYVPTFHDYQNVKERGINMNQDLDSHSYRETIRSTIRLPERLHNAELSTLSDTSNDERIGHNFDNPTYTPTVCVQSQLENRLRNVSLSNVEEPDNISYREMIRNSIQLPEVPPRRRKFYHCKLFTKNYKKKRLLIAQVLFIVLFVMTSFAISISIMIEAIPLKVFQNCWKFATALAFITSLIGVYICWEDNVCISPRPQQETTGTSIELQNIAANP